MRLNQGPKKITERLALIAASLGLFAMAVLLAGCPSKNTSPAAPNQPAPTNTYTVVPSATPTDTATKTSTATSTDTATLTGTPTPSATITNSGTPTLTLTSTDTTTPTPTATNSLTATITNTYTLTPTPSSTDTPTQTATFTITSTSTPTVTSTVTTCTAPVQYGETTATETDGSSGYVMFCEPVTLTSPIYVNSMAVDLAGTATQMRVGIYTNTVVPSGYYAGRNFPGNLITVSNQQALTAGWITVPVAAAYLTADVSGTIYWMAWGGTDSTSGYSAYTNGNSIWSLSVYNGTAYVSPNFPATCDINDAGGGFDTTLAINGCP